MVSLLFAQENLIFTTQEISLRESSDENAKVILTIRKGEKIEIKEEKKEWLHVLVAGKRDGWIYGELVTDAGVVRVSRVKVRDGPGLQYQAIGELKKGDQVVFTGQEGDWVKISYPFSVSGWVKKQEIKPGKTLLPVKTLAKDGTEKKVDSSDSAIIKKDTEKDSFPLIASNVVKKLNVIVKQAFKQKEEYTYAFTGRLVYVWWDFRPYAKYAIVSRDSLSRYTVSCYVYNPDMAFQNSLYEKVIVKGDLLNKKGSLKPVLMARRIDIIKE